MRQQCHDHLITRGASSLWGLVVKIIFLVPDQNQIFPLGRSKTLCCPGSTVNETGTVRINIALRCVLTTIAVEKRCVTCSECVSAALFIQLSKRVRRIMLSYVVSPVIPCFSILPHKRHDFRGWGGWELTTEHVF